MKNFEQFITERVDSPTVLRWLGGSQGLDSVGAKRITRGDSEFSFELPPGYSAQGITKVVITQSGSKYKMEFSGRGKPSKVVDNLSGNELKGTFTRNTGIDFS